MSQENVERADERKAVLREAYEALSRRDVESWLSATHPDATLADHYVAPAAYHGHDELRAWAEQTLEVSSEWRVAPEEFLEGPDGRLVVRLSVTGRSVGAGIPVEGVVYNVFEFRGSKVARVDNYNSRTEALEAVGLRD